MAFGCANTLPVAASTPSLSVLSVCGALRSTLSRKKSKRCASSGSCFSNASTFLDPSAMISGVTQAVFAALHCAYGIERAQHRRRTLALGSLVFDERVGHAFQAVMLRRPGFGR